MPEGRVLITRPEGQAGTLQQGLTALGLQVVHQPMLVLEALPGPEARERAIIQDLDQMQHVIFISANAAAYGMDWFLDYWPQLPIGVHWYGLGPATRRLLAQFGLDALVPQGDMTSEGLLALPQLSEVAGQRVLIVKGEGGRETLAGSLGQRGARVDQLSCYRRRSPQLAPGELADLLNREAIEIVAFSSGEGLNNFLALLSPEENTKLQNLWLLVPSQRVAELARAAGLERLVVSENASDGAVCRALEQWRDGVGETV